MLTLSLLLPFFVASCYSPAPPLQYRWNILRNIRNAIDQNEGGLDKFSQGGQGYWTCFEH